MLFTFVHTKCNSVFLKQLFWYKNGFECFPHFSGNVFQVFFIWTFMMNFLMPVCSWIKWIIINNISLVTEQLIMHVLVQSFWTKRIVTSSRYSRTKKLYHKFLKLWKYLWIIFWEYFFVIIALFHNQLLEKNQNDNGYKFDDEYIFYCNSHLVLTYIPQ